MLRDLAVTRIQDGLGFATRQTDKIILRLQEAQRELELGKTLPRFLLQEDATFTFVEGTQTSPLPTGFLRIDDQLSPFYLTSSTAVPTSIRVVRYQQDAYEAYKDLSISDSPKIMVIRKGVVDFVNYADRDYTIFWNYYKAAESLATNIENAWLANGPEWLIGEAGYRMAKDLRDKDAITIFDDMRKMGRAAVFGEVVASEESSGPLIMGANL